MSFDGIAIYNVCSELKSCLKDCKIDKVYQPERDEIILNLRGKGTSYKLLLTSNAKYPRLHLTNIKKDNPTNAPQFCMVLRKHIQGGRILEINQINFDRIVKIIIESKNDFGDNVIKTLIIEIMGRHSNIILIDENNTILESIKRVPLEKSSVRQIFAGMKYTNPPEQNKLNPLNLSLEEFKSRMSDTPDEKLIYTNYYGISPVIAKEICFRTFTSTDQINITDLYNNFKNIIDNLIYKNQIIIENDIITDFAFVNMQMFENKQKKYFDSASEMLEFYYHECDLYYRSTQKSSDIKKIITNALSRAYKKQTLLKNTLSDIEDRDKLKLYGELITANIYKIKKGDNVLDCDNFYEENQKIQVKLNKDLTPAENAQKYFKKYNKEKRTYNAILEQQKENDDEIFYLNSIFATLDTSLTEVDILEIRSELFEAGYIKKRKNQIKQKERKAKPLHFKTLDGSFDIYVGKNNTQNDELTFKMANGNDLWFHVKDIHGSHVIIKTNGKEVDEHLILIASNLALYYSQSKDSQNVQVDYTLKKHVKKPAKAKPGMVIYDNHKSVFVTVDKNLLDSILKI